MARAFQEAADLGNDQTGTTWTVSYTVGTGANRVLFLATDDVVSSTSAISGVTYAGAAMTKIGGGQGDNGSGSLGDRYHTLWMLVNPATGTNNFVMSRTNNAYIEAAAASYTGCAQSGQPNNSSDFVHTDHTNPSNSARTSTVDNSWHIMSFHRSGSGTTASAGTGTARRIVNAGSSNYAIFDSNGSITPAGSNTLQITGIAGLITVGATISPVATTFIKSLNGLAYASTKSKNGALMNVIKSINGLA